MRNGGLSAPVTLPLTGACPGSSGLFCEERLQWAQEADEFDGRRRTSGKPWRIILRDGASLWSSFRHADIQRVMKIRPCPFIAPGPSVTTPPVSF